MNKGFRFQNRKLFTFTGKEETVLNVVKEAKIVKARDTLDAALYC